MPDAEHEHVPEFYVDGFRLSVTPYSVAFTFSLNPPHPDPSRPPVPAPVCVLRMSLEHAKSTAMLLRKQLRDYERQSGKINLPPGLYTQLGVAEEDWGLS